MTTTTKFSFKTHTDVDKLSDYLLNLYTLIVKQKKCNFIEKEETLTAVKEAAKWIINGKKCLLIHGIPGTGKTVLAQSILWYLQRCQSHNDKLAKSKFISAREFAMLMKDDPCSDQVNMLKNSSFIVLDELGVEPIEVISFGTKIEPAISLLEYRYANDKCTIVTSNLLKSSDHGIYMRYGPRVEDRMRETFDSILMNKYSFRSM